MANASGSKKRRFSYYDMPDSHKRKFCIGGSPENYREIINWLRTICCKEGSVFKGIPSLNPSLKSGVYPFVQIMVVRPDKNYVKFMICKKDLHMIAFTSSSSQVISQSKISDRVARSKGKKEFASKVASCKVDPDGKVVPGPIVWILFDHNYQIDNWKRLKPNYQGRGYIKGTPPENIGPDHMNKAVNILNENNASLASSGEAWETFIVHLCEAARFRPVELMVYKSLLTCNQTCKEFQKEANRIVSATYNDKEDILLIEEGNSNSVSVDKDIHSLIKAVGPNYPNFEIEVRSDYLKELVKSYDDLNLIWYTYCLSNREVAGMESNWPMFSKLYMRYVKSVRFTVAVLCHLEVDEFLMTLKEKVSNQRYENIQAKLAELQNSKKI